VRVFSINTGLDASTVTPGKTAPDESLTTPDNADPCAYAKTGNSRHDSTNTVRLITRIICSSPRDIPARYASMPIRYL
jgi:hypothetical protein